MQRRILITGAGSGLGLALAHRYARTGARVACVDLLGERAEAARAALHGNGHLALVADVGDDAAMQALHDRIVAEWNGLDVLVNNAGIASGGPMTGTSMDEWRRILDIDLLGVVRGCRLFLPMMLAAKHGHVVNTASLAGLAAAPGIMSYGVAKAGVVALSEQLRAELHGSGVRVTVLCPAFFRTNLMDTAIIGEDAKRFAQKMMDRSRDTPDQIADRCFAAMERGDFLVLPSRRTAWLCRLKRWMPGVYFRQVARMVDKHTGKR
jgi:NAD(P)-dependent dehydrogenase (short-subunit alcohol dehydrogenase family)